MLDPKARDAAIEAANEIAIDGAPVPDYVDAILHTYLSASLPADAAELVERLENGSYTAGTGYEPAPPIQKEAASLIQSQAARIGELETFIEKARDFARELEDDGFYQAADDLLNRRAEG